MISDIKLSREAEECHEKEDTDDAGKDKIKNGTDFTGRKSTKGIDYHKRNQKENC